VITSLNTTFFADHFAPIFYIVAPLFRLYDSAVMLIILDTVFTLIGLIALIYLLERQQVKGRGTRLAFVVGYLFTDFLWSAVFFPSHPTHWAMAFLMIVLVMYHLRIFRWWYYIGLILMFACKEEFPFIGLVLGGILIWRGERKAGVWTGGISLLWIILVLFVRPMLLPGTNNHGIFLSVLLSDPLSYWDQWLKFIVRPYQIHGLILMALLLVGHPFKRNLDIWLLIAVPLSVRLLSLHPNALEFQYMAIFVPLIILLYFRSVDESTGRRRKLFILQLVAVSVISLMARGQPLYHPFDPIAYHQKNFDSLHQRLDIIEQLNQLNLRIAAPDNWVPHMTSNPYVSSNYIYFTQYKPRSAYIWVWDPKGNYFPSPYPYEELKAMVGEVTPGLFTYLIGDIEIRSKVELNLDGAVRIAP